VHPTLVPDEDILCTKCAEGDSQAWESLVTQYGTELRKVITRLLGSNRHRESEDVLLELWYTLLKDHCLVLRRFKQKKGTLGAYLSGVARNLVRIDLRRERSRAKRQVSLCRFNPDEFTFQDLQLTQITTELERHATKAECQFLRQWLLQPAGFETTFSETNRRALLGRLLDKAWPMIYGPDVHRTHRARANRSEASRSILQARTKPNKNS